MIPPFSIEVFVLRGHSPVLRSISVQCKRVYIMLPPKLAIFPALFRALHTWNSTPTLVRWKRGLLIELIIFEIRVAVVCLFGREFAVSRLSFGPVRRRFQPLVRVFSNRVFRLALQFSAFRTKFSGN